MKLRIYEIHIFELGNDEINVEKILAVINATYAVVCKYFVCTSVPHRRLLARVQYFFQVISSMPITIEALPNRTQSNLS